jgi:hypothetical protein
MKAIKGRRRKFSSRHAFVGSIAQQHFALSPVMIFFRLWTTGLPASLYESGLTLRPVAAAIDRIHAAMLFALRRAGFRGDRGIRATAGPAIDRVICVLQTCPRQITDAFFELFAFL